jgi:hypothetical protein
MKYVIELAEKTGRIRTTSFPGEWLPGIEDAKGITA